MIASDAVAELRARISAEIDQIGLDSCQFALALDGEVVVEETLGAAGPGARFVVFSATKPLVASVMWQLIAEGALDPDRPVATWWPEFGHNGKDAITLEQVMIHTAGLTNAPLSEAAITDRAVRVEEMESWTLEWEPGTRYEYHGLSAHWILAELVERTTGDDFRAALRRRVLDPLGLDRLELGVPLEHQSDVQAIGQVGEPPSLEDIEELLGIPLRALWPDAELPAGGMAPAGGFELFDLVTRPAILEAGVPGANAVSDASSLALFYQHLLHDPKGLWDPAVLADAKTNVRNRLPDMLGRAAFRTLGFETSGDDEMATKRIGSGATSPGTFGHSGAGGQIAWADPATGLSFVFLTNTFDVNFVRMYRRDAALTRLAAQCVDQ